MLNILEKDFNNAVKEVEFFVTLRVKECIARGWSYYVTDNAPESFKELKERSSNFCIPISNNGCEATIYSSAKFNHMFRFWHDVTHIELNSGFSLNGEMKVIKHHLKEAQEMNLSELAINILRADTEGQVKYYYRNKEFVNNQKAFVQTCLQLGINKAIAYKH